jgi:tryptophan synthase alpha chain
MSSIHETFARAKAENRAVLIGYLPAGYPSKEGAIECITAMVEGGVDIVEIGLPYSDPVMDGPTIQDAVDISLAAGTKTTDVMATVAAVSATGAPSLVMSYWNPIERYGVDKFATDLHAANGVGVITPDLTPEEACDWVGATDKADIDRVFLVALSSSDERIARVAEVTTGFIYAGAVMGVTGARTSLSDEVRGLVARVRTHSDLPIAVGLGVSTPEQAHDIAQYADGVIVGSAFVTAIKQGGAAAAGELARTLASGLGRV